MPDAVRNAHGGWVDTNATRRDHECIEVVLAFPALIQRFEEWLSAQGLYLFPIPMEGDHLPAYGVGIVGESKRSTRPGSQGDE